MALTAPLFADRSELQAIAGRDNPSLAPPSSEFWLGTDELGRDLFALVVWGARVSLYIGLLATVVAVVIGSVFGLIAGYAKGWISRVMLAIDDFFLVLPFIPLAIVLALLLGRSPTVMALVIGGTFWAGGSRLIRAQVLSLRERGYVERAEALGASSRHIVTRHVLPGVAPLIIANASLIVPGAILAESDACVPRSRRPLLAQLGQGARRRAVQRRARRSNAVVVLPAAWSVHHRDRARLHAVRQRARTDLRPAAGGSMTTPLLDVRDLRVTYKSSRGPVPAVRGVVVSPRCRRDVGPRRRERQRQVDDDDGAAAPGPGRHQVTGTVTLAGEDVLTMKPGRLRAVRWAEAAVVFQGAQHVLNPVRRISQQIQEAIDVHGGSNKVSDLARAGRASRAGVAMHTHTSSRADRSSA